MRLKLQCPKSLLLSLFLLLTAIEVHAQGSLTLHYDKPAANWNEALPIGNGRLGAMVFGNPENEQLQLNEATLWSGGPVDKAINPKAFDFLEPAREALKAGDYDKASDLVKNMQGRYTQSYVTMGDLRIKQDLGGKPTSNYYRDLNIQDAISTTRFTADGIEYTREVFASAPADAIIMRIRASKPHQISLSATAKSPLKSSNSAATDFLSLKGRAPTHVDPTNVKYTKEPIIFDDSNSCKGMRFELAVKPIVKDGNLKITNDDIVIKDATEVLLVISAATSFNGFDKCPYSQGTNEHKLLLSHLKKSDKKPYEKLFDEHKRDYQQFFNRVSLQFNSQEESKSGIPTNKRLEDYTQAKSDSELEALYFQFGRYLLICCSRPGGMPANLQGIWCKEIRPSWRSNWRRGGWCWRCICRPKS